MEPPTWRSFTNFKGWWHAKSCHVGSSSCTAASLHLYKPYLACMTIEIKLIYIYILLCKWLHLVRTTAATGIGKTAGFSTISEFICSSCSAAFRVGRVTLSTFSANLIVQCGWETQCVASLLPMTGNTFR